MNYTFKKIYLLCILALVGQLISTEITHAYTGNGQHQRKNKKQKKQKTKTRNNRHPKATTKHRNNQYHVDHPAAVTGAAVVHNDNKQQQEQIENAWALWNTYCNSNPSDIRCNNGANTQATT